MSVHRITAAPEWTSTLPGAQYAYAVKLDQAPAKSPERWARGVFEQAPPLWWRLALAFGWRYVLGLRLGRASSSTNVAGWQVAAEDETSITLAAESRWLSMAAVFVVGPASAVWATVVRYDKPLGGLLWRLIAPVHQLTVPWLFTKASR